MSRLSSLVGPAIGRVQSSLHASSSGVSSSNSSTMLFSSLNTDLLHLVGFQHLFSTARRPVCSSVLSNSPVSAFSASFFARMPSQFRSLFTATVNPGANPEVVMKTLTAHMRRDGVMEFLRFKRYRERPHRVRNNRILTNRIKRKDEEIKGVLNWLAKKRERGG